ncbi:MAG TPA: hypothetical protein V6C76_09020 [Drouetiella sp.]
MTSSDFGFGIEAEFILVDSKTYKPHGYTDLDLQTLLTLVDSIPTNDISRKGFNQKPLHNQASPYLIEGYTLTDSEMNPVDLLPKGIEVRTPLASSLTECTNSLSVLYTRMKERLNVDGMDAAMLSYHPTLPRIDAPANYTRHDYWQWALTATTTYGPDINISVPPDVAAGLDIDRINARINYYSPSVIALTFASPIRENSLWMVDGRVGKSYRTFERSKFAPIFYVHDKPSLRFEFKGFEMSPVLSDYHAMFLISLALLLDNDLDMTASDEERIVELESLALYGVDSPVTQARAAQVLQSAEKIAKKYSLPGSSLISFWDRLKTQQLPSDKIADTFKRTQSVAETLRTRTDFEARTNFDAQTNFEPQTVLDTHRNFEPQTILDTHRNFETQTILDTHRNFETQTILDTHRNFETQTILETQRNFETQTNFEALTNLEASTSFEKTIKTQTNFDPKTSVEARSNLETNQQLDSKRAEANEVVHR